MKHTVRRSGRAAAFVLLPVLVASTLAACADTGSDEPKASGDSASGDSSCTQAAEAYMKPLETLPTTLPEGYTPLSAKPAAGKVVYVGIGTIPEEIQISDAVADAAKSVGWTSSFLSEDGSIEDFARKVDDAINSGADAIVWTGYPPSAIQPQMDEAKAKGVIVAAGAQNEEPTDAAGFAGATLALPVWTTNGKTMANWVMADSQCSGSAAFFMLPYPNYKEASESFLSAMKEGCPECKATASEIQVADIGSPAATQAIISTLQSDPSIKYVGVSTGSIAAGLTPALQQAGIEGVKIFGISPDEAAFKALGDGSNAMWIGQTSEALGWEEFDAVMRVIDTGKPSTDLPAIAPVLTPDNVDPSGGIQTFPADFKDQFTALWQGN
jgi:ABC-type sugar transport system substrate-binding protein